ncbi:MAG: BspA family leucine-rich repeat surface protein [Candidatus Thiodubiliella endoseptemdiera]|uniref:BspA family leucine-rich repeat surface protein n=1 Tax=Candidatus Thiodubiliella endoseptemdiera TaxID=2738886 RepID=A0A853F7U0_9GAMM|nr:BspA family leucine-rich repeat surface protein [Candidatus Thiodubiliella endoseptemdiera]
MKNIDISEVTDISYLFKNCETFNSDISKWNTSQVTNMNYLFYNCRKFNQDLSKWTLQK